MKLAHIRWDGVVLQKGVWVWGVQQRAELFPSAPSKRVAELLGQFLWRVGQRQLVLHRTAPQLHPQLKLGKCVFTAAQQHNPGFSLNQAGSNTAAVYLNAEQQHYSLKDTYKMEVPSKQMSVTDLSTTIIRVSNTSEPICSKQNTPKRREPA